MGQVGCRNLRGLFAHDHSKSSEGGAVLNPESIACTGEIAGDSIDCEGQIEGIDLLKIQDTSKTFYGGFNVTTAGRLNIFPGAQLSEVFIQTFSGHGLLITPYNSPTYNQVQAALSDGACNKNAEVLHIKRGSNTGRYPSDYSTVVIEKQGTNLLEFIGADTNVQGFAFTDTTDGIRCQLLYDHDDNAMSISVEGSMKLFLDALGNLQLTPSFVSDTKTGSKLILLYPGTEPISGIPYHASIGAKEIDYVAYVIFRDQNGDEYIMKKQSAMTAKDTGTIDATWGADEQAIMDNNRTRIEEIENILKALGFLPS